MNIVDQKRKLLFLTSIGGRLFNPTIPEYVVTSHLVKQGYVVSLVMPSRGPLSEALEGLGAKVAILPCLASPRKLHCRLKSAFFMRRMAKEWQDVDLVLGMRTSSAFFGVPLARIIGVPAVAYLHGHTSNISKFTRYRVDQADVVLAVSQSSLSCYQPKPGTTYTQQHCQFIHNGIDADAFVLRSRTRNMRSELKISSNAPVVGMAGAYHGKGMDIFVKAAPLIKKGCPDVQFIVAGEFRSDDFEKDMLSQIQSMGLSESFHCVGQMKEIAPVIAACDLWSMPTRVDAFPMIGLEAMALGKPVVASDVGGVPEMINHEVNGILFDVGEVNSFAEGVLRLLKDSDLRQKYQLSALQRVRSEFDLTTQMNLLEQTLCKAITQGSLSHRKAQKLAEKNGH